MGNSEPDVLCPCGHISDDHSFNGECYGIVGVESKFGSLDRYDRVPQPGDVDCDCKDNDDNGRRTQIYAGQMVSTSWRQDPNSDDRNKGDWVKNEPRRCERRYCNSGELTTKFISVDGSFSNDAPSKKNKAYFFVCAPCLRELAEEFLKQAQNARL